MGRRQELRFLFYDPNTPEAWAEMLKKLLVEKLLAQDWAQTGAPEEDAGEEPV